MSSATCRIQADAFKLQGIHNSGRRSIWEDADFVIWRSRPLAIHGNSKSTSDNHQMHPLMLDAYVRERPIVRYFSHTVYWDIHLVLRALLLAANLSQHLLGAIGFRSNISFGKGAAVNLTKINVCMPFTFYHTRSERRSGANIWMTMIAAMSDTIAQGKWLHGSISAGLSFTSAFRTSVLTLIAGPSRCPSLMHLPTYLYFTEEASWKFSIYFEKARCGDNATFLSWVFCRAGIWDINSVIEELEHVQPEPKLTPELAAVP